MADIYRLPNERQVFREASEWVARLQADDVTAEERANFETWRSAHSLHRRTFDELTGTWSRFAAVRPLVRAVTFGQSVNETAARAEADQARRRSRRYRVAWAAALASIVVGLGVFGYFRPSPGRTYVTTDGEHATVSLPDGSTLELDGDSRARVDFSTRYRMVHLERGEAFFKVVHNAQWPFWVVGGGSWVRDVGTAFNVQLNATGMQVTVSQGMVKVGALAPSLREIPFQDAVLSHETALSVLTAGHQAYLTGSAVKIRPLSAEQLAQAISWRAQTLYFENAPLSEVAEELGRYTPLHLVVAGERLGQLPIAGTFDASPQGVETFLAMLNQGLGLTVHREAGAVVIQPADGTAN
jgi:transmembrane sensor